MFDIKSIDADKKLEGVWAEFEGGEFLIAYAGNLNFQRKIARLQQPHIKQIRKDKLDPAKALHITCKALSEDVLLDWKNVGSEGNEVEFSEGNAYAALKFNESLRDFVGDFSLDIENYKREAIEEEGKSSENT